MGGWGHSCHAPFLSPPPSLSSSQVRAVRLPLVTTPALSPSMAWLEERGWRRLLVAVVWLRVVLIPRLSSCAATAGRRVTMATPVPLTPWRATVQNVSAQCICIPRTNPSFHRTKIIIIIRILIPARLLCNKLALWACSIGGVQVT